jgi:hypothetical protein
VLFWSPDPVEQRGWRAAGVAGAMPRDGFMVSLDNRGGNKLDQFLAVDVALRQRAVAAGSEVTATITVANLTPPTGLTRYVQGPFEGTGLAPGEYRGILAVSVPTAAGSISLDGVSRLVAAGPDGVTRVVAGDLQLARGASATYTARFTVPRGAEHLEVVSSARTPPIGYRFGDASWRDDAPRSLRW